MFPIIETIDDVLPHIRGNDNFHVNYKEDYIVIDYIVNTPDTFHNAVEKECRGIIFYKDGRIMARRLHKFFNVNERPETLVENLDFSKPHVILEKLDGSMVTTMISYGKMTWGSKAGVTFLTPQIEAFVEKNPKYLEFANWCMSEWSMTPIFEWCSNQNRIVISHPEDRLVLIGIRHNVSGNYLEYSRMNHIALAFDVDVVKQYPGTVASMQELVEAVKPMEGLEGFVVRWSDGSMVKIKADQYCLLHRSKDELAREKNVIAILVEGMADDFRVLLTEPDREKFEEFEYEFWCNFNEQADNIFGVLEHYNATNMTRKEFALESKDWVNSYVRATAFTFFDKISINITEVKQHLLDILKKNTGSQTNVDKARSIWDNGNLKWVY